MSPLNARQQVLDMIQKAADKAAEKGVAVKVEYNEFGFDGKIESHHKRHAFHDEREAVKIIEFKPAVDVAEALRTLDTLRAAIESGSVVCFAAVGIARDDATMMWLANVGKAKTNLQLMGAIENLKLHFWRGDIS